MSKCDLGLCVTIVEYLNLYTDGMDVLLFNIIFRNTQINNAIMEKSDKN